MILNPQQKAAIQYTDGPLLVLAGAGSGKTRVITEKIVHLITKTGVSAKQICAVTFTNKAAQEMNHRLGQVLSVNEKKGLLVGTFHNLGLQLIKRETRHFNLPKRFSLMDEEDSRQSQSRRAGGRCRYGDHWETDEDVYGEDEAGDWEI